MANESIYAAFERMWQHVIAKFNEITKPDPILDKTSENPIMNKAVAEALEDLSASGGFVVQAEPPENKSLLWVDTDDESEEVEIPQGGGGSEWELLTKIELTEPVKTLLIETDSKGNPLKLKRFYAYFELYSPADTETGNINVMINQQNSYPKNVMLFVAANANGRVPWVYFDAEKLWLIRQNDGWTNNPTISAPVTTMTHLAAKNALNGKEFVENIWVSAPTALIEGTKVTIWGVKA